MEPPPTERARPSLDVTERTAASASQESNAEGTAALVEQLDVDQHPPARAQQLPGNVSATINECVGDNYLGTADELRAIADRVNSDRWINFFRDKLVPAAQKGFHSLSISMPEFDVPFENPWSSAGMLTNKGEKGGRGGRGPRVGKGVGFLGHRNDDKSFLMEYFPGLEIQDVVHLAGKHDVTLQVLPGTYIFSWGKEGSSPSAAAW
eukprot:TRINITY_DN22004_c0_g4_i1.p1 TRINITY_DN22004_c0_g4~~TRINITY_DN22004_c0_g4_i1.p1  ORF type:complete len:207 (-),score=37.70 TRINITY_DN22004_c0_g4_i1:134-754(-)